MNVSKPQTTMKLVSEQEIVITRTFQAPARIVFDAWTKAENVRRWWAPKSHGLSVVECEVDLRPGGSYRYVLEREGQRIGFAGEYLEIERPTRIVYTQRLEPHPDAVVVTVTFEEREGATTLVAHERYPSKLIRDLAIESGMEAGMRETLEQLVELVELDR